jgi:hypothetical protein
MFAGFSTLALGVLLTVIAAVITTRVAGLRQAIDAIPVARSSGSMRFGSSASCFLP